MSPRFSYSSFRCCYMILLIVVSLFYLCLSNKNFGDDILCMASERQALLRFKHSLIDEAGRLASWDVGEESDCCKWVGIGCDNITGHVHGIYLPALNGHCKDHFFDTAKEYEQALKQRLRGSLSSSLMHLKQLMYLDLSCNDFEEIKVPKFIGSLTNLRYLNLSQSNFGEVIPPQLGNLSELHVLCLGSFHEVIYETESTSMSNMEWLSSLHSLQHLDLSGVDLSNAIDWLQVINTLPSLVELHLSSTFLTDIHPHISSLNLTSLSVLDLSYNDFSSSFPQWMFSINSLVSLDISHCSFHRLIPSSMNSFRNLTSLKFLHVSQNDFMNSSLVLKELSNTIGGNLISLDISYCGISSSVLDSLHNLTSLLSLDLLGNQLTERIPKSLGYNLCNLRDLDLSYNDFRNITLTYLLQSFFMCKSSALESLIVTSTKLSGTIPNSIGRLSFLRSLDLGLNLISGPIPSSFGQLSSLEKLVLSYNQLNDGLPYSIGKLSSLKHLDLSKNQLNGSLPNSLGQLSKLEVLTFSLNLLTGVVSEAHFSKLTSLKYLNGEGNNLTLRTRLANWIPPFHLQSLNLNSWGLGPLFPMWLQSQKDLVDLEISNTGISSLIPPGTFWRSLPNLAYLVMSQNHIQGTLKLLDIPATVLVLDLSSNDLTGELSPISNFPLLNALDLSNNSFTGSLHDFLCSNGVKQTQHLYLGNNQLSGVVPECWEKWPQLSTLNLENNNFSGRIPATLGFSSRLESLNMRRNKLSGRLPTSLMNLTNLEILQLGRNRFVGSIPSWFGTEFFRLRILNLRSNNFNGNIPDKICYLKHIQILDLAHNNLSGNIPLCFNNFSVLTGNETIKRNEIYLRGVVTGMSTKAVMSSESLVMKGREDTYSSILGLVMLLDLSCNYLIGNIPSELTFLRGLKTLNFSGNRLTGRIPEKIGDMKSLETFDLSLNKLSGELPVSLSQLHFLSNFNVSYNNLSGRVPSSTQLQSFNENSFLGNKLCGPPLTEPCVHVEVPTKTNSDQPLEDDGAADWVLFISCVLGFVSGFCIVLVPLIVSKSWRIAYFGFLSNLKVQYL